MSLAIKTAKLRLNKDKQGGNDDDDDGERRKFGTSHTFDPLVIRDIDTFKKTLVTSIRNDHYNRAREIVEANESLVAEAGEELVNEIAYIYYKLNDPKVEQVATSYKDKRSLKHILAQYYYQCGQSKKALQIYQSLSMEDELHDVSVNERAVIVQMLMQGAMSNEIQPITPIIDDSYDQLFNVALLELCNGQARRALETLGKALELTQQLDDVERKIEQTPIKQQMAYIDLLLGNPSLFDNSLTGKFNTLSKEKVESPHLAIRELDLGTVDINQYKLTTPQLAIVKSNIQQLDVAIGKSNYGVYRTIQEAIDTGNYQRAITLVDPSTPALGKLLITLLEKINSKKLPMALLSIIESFDSATPKEYITFVALKLLPYDAEKSRETLDKYGISLTATDVDTSSVNVSALSIDDLLTPTSHPTHVVRAKRHRKPRHRGHSSDPERWLPLKDRSSFKSSKKSKRSKLTQGI